MTAVAILCEVVIALINSAIKIGIIIIIIGITNIGLKLAITRFITKTVGNKDGNISGSLFI